MQIVRPDDAIPTSSSHCGYFKVKDVTTTSISWNYNCHSVTKCQDELTNTLISADLSFKDHRHPPINCSKNANNKTCTLMIKVVTQLQCIRGPCFR